MAGHSKWSKVKHIKARVDAIKGRVFSKCAHEIALAARAGGSDPAENSRLRTAIDSAKSVSMPKDNIDRVAANELGSTANALRTSGLNIISEKLVSIPQTSCVVSDLSTARQVLKLDDLLDDYADTLNFMTNFDVADPILDQLAS
ncbi:MAG: YebC/PmpR family DNA-binding transcriptional regulator [Akkermansiaceae bacterium]|nr:YebC/PmpR family DNA-binding transcriptional regulator [Akkermansiaceae bacterium]